VRLGIRSWTRACFIFERLCGVGGLTLCLSDWVVGGCRFVSWEAVFSRFDLLLGFGMVGPFGYGSFMIVH
jgi:hypothetical protein